MARLGLRITDEMGDALKQEAAKTRILSSELVRMALEEFLAKRGYKLESTIEWGGNRHGDKAENEE